MVFATSLPIDIHHYIDTLNPLVPNYPLLIIAAVQAFLFTHPRYNKLWTVPLAAIGFALDFYLGLALWALVIAYQSRRLLTGKTNIAVMTGVWIILSTIVTYLRLPRYDHYIYITYGSAAVLAVLYALWHTLMHRHSSTRLPTTNTEDRDKTRFATKEMATQVLARYGNSCANCGARGDSPGVALEMDHIIPYARGGPTTVSNLQPLCGPCNRAKSDMSMDEFMDWQAHHPIH